MSTAEFGPSSELLASFFGEKRWRRATYFHYLEQYPLEKIQSRIEHLNQIFRGDYWKSQTVLVASLPDSLDQNVMTLDTIFRGRRWTNTPRLARFSSRSLIRNADYLTDLFQSESWKRYPRLVSRNRRTLAKNAQALSDLIESDKWKKYLSLITIPLATLHRKASILAKLVGSDRWKMRPDLLEFNSKKLIAAGEILTVLFEGDQWKRYPQMLGEVTQVEANVPRVDSIFGSYPWKNHPQIALQSPDTLAHYAENHSRNFGSDDWKAQPTLISITPRTFNASLRALRMIGVTPETQAHDICLALSTSMDTKRRKVKLIREKLLGHKHIYTVGKQVSIGQYAAFRARLTDEEKDAERTEIEELIRFLQRNHRLIIMSEEVIIKRSKERGIIS